MPSPLQADLNVTSAAAAAGRRAVIRLVYGAALERDLIEVSASQGDVDAADADSLVADAAALTAAAAATAAAAPSGGAPEAAAEAAAAEATAAAEGPLDDDGWCAESGASVAATAAAASAAAPGLLLGSELAFRARGFVSSSPFNGTASKKAVFILFVNDRLVESSALRRTIEAAVADTLPRGAHPPVEAPFVVVFFFVF